MPGMKRCAALGRDRHADGDDEQYLLERPSYVAAVWSGQIDRAELDTAEATEADLTYETEGHQLTQAIAWTLGLPGPRLAAILGDVPNDKLAELLDLVIDQAVDRQSASLRPGGTEDMLDAVRVTRLGEAELATLDDQVGVWVL